MEKAYEFARKAGVLYPYLGNVRGHRYENTYCPNCGEKLIQRLGCIVTSYNVTYEKQCPKCGQPVPIMGKHISKSSL